MAVAAATIPAMTLNTRPIGPKATLNAVPNAAAAPPASTIAAVNA